MCYAVTINMRDNENIKEIHSLDISQQ